MGDKIKFVKDKDKFEYRLLPGNERFLYKLNIVGGRGKEGKSAYEVAVENGFVGTVEEWLESFSNVCERNSVYEFPNIGKPNVLYIDKSGNGTYRWDDVDRKYYCIGNDYTQIRCIDGGKANNG